MARRGALEIRVSPVVGRLSDRRGRLFPCLIGLAAAAELMLLFPLPSRSGSSSCWCCWRRRPSGCCGRPRWRCCPTAPRRSGSRRASRSRFEPRLVDRADDRHAASARLADATSDAVPYLLLCVICASTLAFASPAPARDRGAHVTSFWLDQPGARPPRPPLDGAVEADLASSAAASPGCGPRCWPRSATPARDVVLLEARAARLRRVRPQRRLLPTPRSPTGSATAWRASPTRSTTLERLGAREPRRASRRPSSAHGIDCDFEGTGELAVATEPHQVRWLAEEAAALRAVRPGRRAARRATRCAPRSTRRRYLGGALGPRDGAALVDPARLAWGLRAGGARRLGVRIYEGTPGDGAARATAPACALRRPAAQRARAGGSLLGTNAFPPLLRAIRRLHRAGLRLRADDRAADRRRSSRRSAGRTAQGLGDSANQFHYYRLTRRQPDPVGRLRRGLPLRRPGRRPSSTSARRRSRCSPSTSSRRSRSSRGCASPTAGAARSTPAAASARFFGTALGGRVGYALGYTGLGVGATRFGAEVMLDLLDGARHRAHAARDGAARRPLPFPPEPLRCGRHPAHPLVAGARRPREGRRNLWLRTLDRLGLGFDS